MNQGIGADNFDIDKLRARLRKMSDEQLIEFGKNVRYLCGSKANFGKPASAVWLIQLQEGQAEWRRRHPKKTESNTK
jgi:hypothetical protein